MTTLSPSTSYAQNRSTGKIIQFPIHNVIDKTPKLQKVSSSKLTAHGKPKARAADSIKDPEHIRQIETYFIDKKQYRNYMMIVLGVSVGLRIGDLLSLKVQDVMNDDGTFKEHIYLIEEKTNKANTPKLTKRAQEAVSLYLSTLKSYNSDDYLFKSRKGKNQPIDEGSAHRILADMNRELKLPYHIGTHSLRKTLAYWTIRAHPTNPVILTALQEMLNHSCQRTTLRYAGITIEESDSIYDTVARVMDGSEGDSTGRN